MSVGPGGLQTQSRFELPDGVLQVADITVGKREIVVRVGVAGLKGEGFLKNGDRLGPLLLLGKLDRLLPKLIGWTLGKSKMGRRSPMRRPLPI